MSVQDWHIAVLIPARDEERLLPRCLRSVQDACQFLPQPVTSDIVVVTDRCTDSSARLAREMLDGRGVVIPTNVGCVGRARSLAARVALERFGGAKERCWLANTDADCEVPKTWLLDQLVLAQKGYMAVAGVVDVDSFEEHDEQVPKLFRLSYVIHPDGSHPHVHGANLGIRADSYLDAGGWHELHSAEDHDLWRRLQRGSHRCIADGNIEVLTSGRRMGRAPHGFAGALAAHNGTSG